MRRPPKPQLPSGGYAGTVKGVRDAVAKELMRMYPIQCLFRRPVIRASHIAPAVLVIRIEGMSHISSKQFEVLVAVMNDAAPPYATCVLTLGEKQRG